MGGSLRGYACSLPSKGDADDLEEFNFVREERERVKNAAKAVCFSLLILRTRKRLLRSKSGSERIFHGPREQRLPISLLSVGPLGTVSTVRTVQHVQ